MPRYPFQPDILDALPEQLAELFRGLEDTLLEEICSRLKIADDLNQVTVEDIKALRALGIPLREIEQVIQQTVQVSASQLAVLFADVAARRAVLTGINQINQKYREQSMDYLETDLVEVTAHSGARDTPTGTEWGKWITRQMSPGILTIPQHHIPGGMKWNTGIPHSMPWGMPAMRIPIP